MGLYLNPSNKLFQRSLDAQFYVDKTELATFLNKRMGQADGLVCVSRPRRFGKSVDADMLAAYYSRGAESRAQFEGLYVSRSSSFDEHLNKHDVIKLVMTQMIALAEGPDGIPAAVTEEVLAEVRETWPQAVPESTKSLPKALALVEAQKGTGFVFIIDEWDCIMREAENAESAQRAYLDFLRDLLKDRSYVEACYMTGILPIRKYGQHSALNLFREYSMATPDELAHLMGFNADEVEKLCERLGRDFSEMERWYDGYVLGEKRIHVYNPNSVARSLSSGRCSSYWTQTETYEALQRYIDIDFDGVGTDLVAMLDGAKVPADISNFENSMTDFKSKDDVYALLVHLGYLGHDEEARSVFIPNEEIRREFAGSLKTGARPQLARLIGESRELQQRTLEGDETYVADAIQRAHASAAGPRYYNDEQALRAAVKLAYIWSIDDYLRVDELPGGRGYADVAYIPKTGSSLPPLVIELKWNKPADAAIEQITRRNYPAALRELTGECVLVGITYDEKTTQHSCKIERVRLGGKGDAR